MTINTELIHGGNGGIILPPLYADVKTTKAGGSPKAQSVAKPTRKGGKK